MRADTAALPLDYDSYNAAIAATRDRRMRWWREARFGMFLHWGPYSVLGRGEWVRNMERIPLDEYDRVAASWRPKPGAARAWCRWARQAGMRYAVMTTKHHDGFCLWDSRVSDFNAARIGPRRDLVGEFVEACRAEGLKVGLYYSLMDWHHPDGATGEFDVGARERFQAYTHGLVRELCSNYGRIDMLWYDVPVPLFGWSPGGWDSIRMNAEVRRRQPRIIINNRSCLPEDFSTPERHIAAAEPGRDWESCMTTTCSWCWAPLPAEAWLRARDVIEMLRTVIAGGGNLLLNVGPAPDGSLPAGAKKLLSSVGRWIERHQEPVYGRVDRVRAMETTTVGDWTARGNTRYLWMRQWPGTSFAVGGLTRRPRRARLLPNGRDLSLRWEAADGRVVVDGLPDACPDRDTGYAVLAFEFDGPVVQVLGPLMKPKRPIPAYIPGLRSGPYVASWQLSRLHVRPADGVAEIASARLDEPRDWRPLAVPGSEGVANLHRTFARIDGIAYLATRLRVPSAGRWRLWIGHDGGVRAFVDGRPVLSVPEAGALREDRSSCVVDLTTGLHELCLAFDVACGQYLSCCWEAPEGQRLPPLAAFPTPV